MNVFTDGTEEPTYPADSFADLLTDELSMNFRSAPPEVIARLAKICQRALKSALAGAATGVPEAPAGTASKELLASVIAEIVSSPQPRLAARCVDFVLGLGVDADAPTQSRIGEIEGCTRALVSLNCIRLKQTLLGGQRTPAGMRSAEAVETYRAAQPRHRQSWESASQFSEAFRRIAQASGQAA